MEWRRLRSLLLTTGPGKEESCAFNTFNFPQSGLSPTMTFNAYKPVEQNQKAVP